MDYKMKIINITPEHLPNHGDCLSSIIYKIFKYNNKSNYEIIFSDQGEIGYVQACDINTAFDTNELLLLPKKNYFSKLETYLNVVFRSTNNIDSIKQTIDQGQPIICYSSAYIMPWRRKYGASTNERHACLIIGYDDNKQYICIDPIFESGLLYLPYSNIDYKSTKNILGYFDFSQYKDIKNINMFGLVRFFESKSVEGEYSFNSFANLAHDIVQKNLTGKLCLDNYERYLLSNYSWFFLIARATSIRLFFEFLYNISRDKRLIKIEKLADKEHSILKIACNLVLKYSRTGNDELILSVIEKLNECADIEKEMNNILQCCCQL